MMTARNRILSCVITLVLAPFCYGQISEYNYRQEIKGVKEQWHNIILPDEMFGDISQDLSDIKIYGITPKNDTIETPYLFRIHSRKTSIKNVTFNTLNVSNNKNGYYFTFEVPNNETINQIKLEFKQDNFDWRLKLEGSQDLKEWHTIVEDYRILSIKKDHTDFKFTNIKFQSSKYQYFRILINSKESPKLSAAKISLNIATDGLFRKYHLKKITTKENKHTKQTEIDVEMNIPARISHLNINVLDTFDYYRPLTIKYVMDSLNTQQGWKYNYKTLTTGILNSIKKNEFQFPSTTIQKLKIIINNNDNHPLTLNKLEAKGYIHELVSRFTGQATYYLTYGNKKAVRPIYDIEKFTNTIPETLTKLELGEKLFVEKASVPVNEPLFKNKIWLWAIMAIVIVLLGGFSIKMIKEH